MCLWKYNPFVYRETYEYVIGEIEERMEKLFETKDTLTDHDYKEQCDSLHFAYKSIERRFGESERGGAAFLAEVGKDMSCSDLFITTLQSDLVEQEIDITVENIAVEMMMFSLEMLDLADGEVHWGKKHWKYKINEAWWQYRIDNKI
jgi:hypothetical protein